MSTRDEIERAFRDAVKAHPCPACGVRFSDFAIEWGDAWREGYLDCLWDKGLRMRDGPFKLKCEACKRCSWYKVFGDRVELAEEREY